MSLHSDIEAAIVAAWIDAPVVATAPRSEPNHVARLIGHASQPIADAIVANTRARSATVRSTFCHQNPYAFWQSPTSVLRCELADLLLIVRTPMHERAVLLQTKMRDMKAKAPWVTGHTLPISGKALIQRTLYAGLPPFHLEFTGSNSPTAYDARNAGSVARLEADFLASHGRLLTPFALGALPASTPAGLIYAGIDNTSPRTAQPMPWSPWLIEAQRPRPGTKQAQFGTTLADTLSELIRKPASDVGLPLDTAAYPDWARLVGDLQDWADDWFSNPEYHASNHDVTTMTGTYEPSAFDNLGQSGQAAFMCWAAAGTARTWNAAAGSHRVPTLDHEWHMDPIDRYLFTRSPFEPSRWVVDGNAPPGRNGSAAREEEGGSSGFGVMELTVRFRGDAEPDGDFLSL